MLYPLRGASAVEYANSVNATLASNRGSGFSLSPTSLRDLPAGYRLVLPPPNGAALAFSVEHPVVLTACLRNAEAVARAAMNLGRTFAVIPAGEMWKDGTVRPSVEDLLGAGAVIRALSGSCSPESTLAAAAFEHCRRNLSESLRTCCSGKELIERGFAQDVEMAAEFNVSANIPRLVNRAFLRVG